MTQNIEIEMELGPSFVFSKRKHIHWELIYFKYTDEFVVHQ